MNTTTSAPAPEHNVDELLDLARLHADAELQGRLDDSYRRAVRRADKHHYTLAALVFVLLMLTIVQLINARYPYVMNVGHSTDRAASYDISNQIIASL